MKTVAEIRRSNLESLVAEIGSLESVADAASSSAIYLSQVKHQTIDRKTGKPRQMGGAIARRLEVGCNKPKGWMDKDHSISFIPGEASGGSSSNQAPLLIGRSGNAIEIDGIDSHPDYAPVRRVNIKAQAGVSGFSVEYVHDDEKPPIFFRRDWYRAKGFAPDRMIAVRVTGESMIPTLHPDDLIVINTAQTQPQHSKTFLVSYEGEIVVKRLVRDDGQWWLTSDNPDQRRYPRVKCNGETQIIGEVVYRQTEVI